jgi:predicted alpha/beta superfamily hydrolase
MKRVKSNIPRLLAIVVSMLAITTPASMAAEAGTNITIGQRFEIESKVLGETRRYFVHTPYKYRLRSDRYPVLIVLDGNVQFAQASAAVDYLAYSGRIPPMIVVGVTNTQRQRDLLAPGSDKFLSFLADELLPQIDKTYRTHSYRVLVGHSLGGSFVVHALQKQPQMFQGYIASSPSLQANGEALVKTMPAFLEANPDVQADLYVTVGDEGSIGAATERLSNVLKEKAPAGLRWKYLPHKDETHQSIPYRGIHEGLQQVFDGWVLAEPVKLYDQSGIAGIEAHYAQMSERLGYTVPVQGVTLEKLFTQFLMDGRFADADVVVKKTSALYPDDTLVHTAAIMLYSMTKDTPRVIEHAKKSLSLNPGDVEAARTLKLNGVETGSLTGEVSVSQAALKHLIGSYSSVDEFIDISIKNDKLYCATDAGEFEMKAVSETSFYLAGASARLTFIKDKRGKATSVRLDRLGSRLYATETLTGR